MTASESAFSFGRESRLRRPSEFRRVFDGRLSVADATMVVYGLPNEGGPARLGLSVSKKIGGAVTRNGWKRHIREAFRHQHHDLSGWDVVVIPRRGALCDAAQIGRSLGELTQRLQRKQSRRRAGK